MQLRSAIASGVAFIWRFISSSTTRRHTTFTYNPGQPDRERARTNDTYAWNGQVDRQPRLHRQRAQPVQRGRAATSFAYDANGNLTSDGTNTLHLRRREPAGQRAAAARVATLRYDPLGRLYEVAGSDAGTTRFLYDGDALVAEYNGSRHAAAPLRPRPRRGDDPLVWFEGAASADPSAATSTPTSAARSSR